MSRDKAKSFMFVCIGIAALVVAFQLGASTAVSQETAGSDIVAVYGNAGDGNQETFFILENGDMWRVHYNWPQGVEGVYHYYNFYAETGVVPTATTSFGDVKSTFR